MNLKARTKEKLAVGRPIGGIGRLSNAKIKKYYGLAIRQNTIRKSNPARRKLEVAVYAMKKKTLWRIATMLSQITLQNSIDFVHQMNPLGVNGSKIKTTGTSTYSCVNCWPEIFLEVLKPTFTT